MSFMDRYSRKVYRNVAASVGLDLSGDGESQGEFYTVDGHDLRCSHCSQSLFVPVELGLAGCEIADQNTAEDGAEAGSDASETRSFRVQALECVSCGHIEFFSDRRELVAESDDQ